MPRLSVITFIKLNSRVFEWCFRYLSDWGSIRWMDNFNLEDNFI